MRLEFALAIDPLFDYAIELLAKLEAGLLCDPAVERAAILTMIQRVDTLLGNSPSWEFARYAIAAWIDEMLLTMPWEGADWWREHILEMELFQSRICSLRFYELAREASGLTCRDALEVYYNCVLLGFRGMYAEPDFTHSNTGHGEWPTTIEQWIERTLPMIEITPRLSDVEGPQRSIEGAMPLSSSHRVVGWSVAAILMLVVNGAVYQLLYGNR